MDGSEIPAELVYLIAGAVVINIALSITLLVRRNALGIVQLETGDDPLSMDDCVDLLADEGIFDEESWKQAQDDHATGVWEGSTEDVDWEDVQDCGAKVSAASAWEKDEDIPTDDEEEENTADTDNTTDDDKQAMMEEAEEKAKEEAEKKAEEEEFKRKALERREEALQQDAERKKKREQEETDQKKKTDQAGQFGLMDKVKIKADALKALKTSTKFADLDSEAFVVGVDGKGLNQLSIPVTYGAVYVEGVKDADLEIKRKCSATPAFKDKCAEFAAKEKKEAQEQMKEKYFNTWYGAALNGRPVFDMTTTGALLAIVAVIGGAVYALSQPQKGDDSQTEAAAPATDAATQ